jgi:hypothetical protein
VAVTYANGVETLYIDGVAVGQLTKPAAIYSTEYRYFLGTGFAGGWTGGNGSWHFFQGRLDEVAVYQRALTAADIAQHYGSGSSNP